jgi:hypothetical protein
MEKTVTLSVTLPISKTKWFLTLVKQIEDDDAPSAEPPAVPEPRLSSDGLTFVIEPLTLAHLLDDQLRKLVSFAVEHNGTFYNKDLAEELEIDTPLTSIYLGHLTRKLTKTGIASANWYTKHRTQNGTLLRVREDVLEKFRKAITREVPEGD